MRITESRGRVSITLDVSRLGADVIAVLSGGAAHVGCAVLAQPRQSLSGDGTVSCTSSVINRSGHKDERLCRMVAETLCESLGAAAVCAGGVHIDAITPDEIQTAEELCARAVKNCLSAGHPQAGAQGEKDPSPAASG